MAGTTNYPDRPAINLRNATVTFVTGTEISYPDKPFINGQSYGTEQHNGNEVITWPKAYPLSLEFRRINFAAFSAF